MRACARTRTYKRVHLCTQTEPSPTRTAGYSLQGAVNRFCSKSQRAGLFLHLAGGGGRGGGPPSEFEVPHSSPPTGFTDTQGARRPGSAQAASYLRVYLNGLGNKEQTCWVPCKEMEFSLRCLWPPELSYPAEGTSRWRSSPHCQECFASPHQQRELDVPQNQVAPCLGQVGVRFRAGRSPRCELSHICVSCHHGLCEKRAALRCHPRLEATSRVCTWDSLVTCQAT